MSTLTASERAIDKNQQRRGRMQGILISAIILLPMIAALIIYYSGLGLPSNTVNKGELLNPPFALKSLSNNVTDDISLLLERSSKKWRYLIIGGSECDQRCQEQLYLTRQVHIRLGEKAGRVERVYLSVDTPVNEPTATFLQQEHPHIKQWVVSAAALDQQLKQSLKQFSSESYPYLLMDQEGFVMMAYNTHHNGNQLLDDIKKLLKYSYED